MDKIINYIKSIYCNYKQNKAEQIKQQFLIQQQQCMDMILLQIQYELGMILSCIHISSKLCAIKSHNDILPIGYYFENNMCIYKFVVSKSITDDIIPIAILNIIKDKINKAINNQQKRLYFDYINLDYFGQYELIQQYPMLINGFRVKAITNEPNDIIIHIVLF